MEHTKISEQFDILTWIPNGYTINIKAEGGILTENLIVLNTK